MPEATRILECGLESGVHEAPRAKTLPPMLMGLLSDVCAAFMLAPEDVLGRRRYKSVSAARQLLCWALRQAPWRRSYPEIGKLIGRDHTTVMFAVARIEREIARGSEIGAIALGLVPSTTLQLVPGEGLMLEERGQRAATGATSGPMSSSASKEGRGQE